MTGFASRKLVGIDEYRDIRFTPKSAPTKRTIRKWLEEGELPGKKIGKLWFVDIAAEEVEGHDELVNTVLGQSHAAS